MNNQQERLKRCPKGTYRNKTTGFCEPKIKSSPRKSPRKSPTRRTRCKNGTYRNRITGLCESKRKSPVKSPVKSPLRSQLRSPLRSPLKSPLRSPFKSPLRSPLRSPVKSPVKSPLRSQLKSPGQVKSPFKRKNLVRRTRCPNGKYRNRITGLCESKRKSPPLEDENNYRSPVIRRSPSLIKSPSYLSVLKNKRFIRDDNYILTPKLLNFYKENSTPIVEDKYIHPGTEEFNEIAFNYLSNRYDNFSYPKLDSGKHLLLTFFILQEPRFFNGKLHISVRYAKKNKEYLIYDLEDENIYKTHVLKHLTNRIKKAIETNKRFITIRVNLQEFTNSAHANILIYDTKKNTLELFDPHGSKTMDKFKPIQVRILIKIIFDEISPDITFLQSYEINPFVGLQTVQTDEKLKMTNEISGYCAAWSFFYFQMRIANPDLSQMTLIRQIKTEIINKGNFYNMIRNYVKYILNSGYRHKYNIKPRKLKI